MSNDAIYLMQRVNVAIRSCKEERQPSKIKERIKDYTRQINGCKE